MSSRDLCIMACRFCRDEQFQEWAMCDDPDEAKAFIMSTCNVKSRNEIDTNPEAAERFHEEIRKPFLAWKDLA